jgi:hypothetical protein
MSVTAAMGVAHGQMLTSVILHDYEQIVTNKATADAFCLNKINSSWKGCGVIKQNYYNQDCEAGDTLLYGYNYVTYVPTLTMSSSTWVSCHIKGKAFIACSPSC